MASSPIIVDGVLVVHVENDSDSFAAGIEMEHGTNLWRKNRVKRANWTSPVKVAGDGGPDLVALQGSEGVDVLHPRTGELAWRYTEGAATIPSCAADARGRLYIPSNGLTAVKGGANEEAEFLWRAGSLRPGTASPLVHEGNLYVIDLPAPRW